MVNGYANRFLFACVRRGQLLPHGGMPNDKTVAMLGQWVAEALAKARAYERVTMTTAAAQRWAGIYKELSTEQPGLLGAITARAEAQTLRLALVYALIDSAGDVWEPAEMRCHPGSKGAIDVVHLEAALAVWRFCEASARIIFGDTVGDPVADEILRALRACLVTGMTRTDLYHQFRHAYGSATAIGAALTRLQQLGKVRCERVASTGPGRPSETWFATAA
jgi:hypothetical protein